jgi:hypothetical protein
VSIQDVQEAIVGIVYVTQAWLLSNPYGELGMILQRWYLHREEPRRQVKDCFYTGSAWHLAACISDIHTVNTSMFCWGLHAEVALYIRLVDSQ